MLNKIYINMKQRKCLNKYLILTEKNWFFVQQYFHWFQAALQGVVTMA